jgi:alpha-1,2-rhamnosyltransferase
MRVFIECTSTLASPYNTGIQRASRNLVAASLTLPGPWSCTAVAYNGRHLISVDAPPARAASRSRPSASERMRSAFHGARSAAVRALPSSSLSKALHSQRLEYALRRAVNGTQNAASWLGSFADGQPRVEFTRGDALVLLDPSWNIDLSGEIDRARAAGVKVWVVVNDLIPIDFPDLAPEGSPTLMRKWLRRVATRADGMLAISRSTADDLRVYLAGAHSARAHALPVDFFYLGVGLDPEPEDAPLDAITRACDADCAFLMVGTLEPRKNYALVVELFDRMWAAGSDARLVIFGRVGWKSETLVRHLRTHRQRNRRLFWFESGSDRELEYAYRHAAALIFPSRCEGFGLPLVEAMQYGLPVIASDIPVFREIGGDYPVYCTVNDQRMLERALHRECIQHGAAHRRARRPWLSWPESARMLLEKVSASP